MQNEVRREENIFLQAVAVVEETGLIRASAAIRLASIQSVRLRENHTSTIVIVRMDDT